ncbi:MAG: zf-HC2 domain-containing protein, partial [Acidimicrobiales bacterium]
MTAPHLDDDALSALVDGEATPGDREHLADCPACQAELAALAAVARAIATPGLPPVPGEVDAAIARALRSWEAGPSEPAVPRSTPGDQPAGSSVAPGDDSGDRGSVPV